MNYAPFPDQNEPWPLPPFGLLSRADAKQEQRKYLEQPETPSAFGQLEGE
jgi:hypothetical protein